MVGEKRSSHAITEEYAKADPVYIKKTVVSMSADSPRIVLTACQALPQKYSHYRPIAGDGNCGWRGMLLSYKMSTMGLTQHATAC
jgi:ubiquitin thioesterase protein OTUB1